MAIREAEGSEQPHVLCGDGVWLLIDAAYRSTTTTAWVVVVEGGREGRMRKGGGGGGRIKNVYIYSTMQKAITSNHTPPTALLGGPC